MKSTLSNAYNNIKNTKPKKLIQISTVNPQKQKSTNNNNGQTDTKTSWKTKTNNFIEKQRR